VTFLSGIATASGQRVNASTKTAKYLFQNTDLDNFIRSAEALSNGLDGDVLVICPLLSVLGGLADWQAWQDSYRANICGPTLRQEYKICRFP
jgi:hypothetical protein